MNTDIDFANVQDLNNDYQAYCQGLGETAEAIGNACDSLTSLPTFQGETAMAVKARFGQAHVTLLASLDTLAQQLMSDYNSKFYPEFRQSPISESRNDARWPSSVMHDTETKLASWQSSDLPEIASRVRAAANALPAGSSAAGIIPNELSAKTALDFEQSQTRNVRNAVIAADDTGFSTFAAKDGDFANLQRAISATIRACANTAITSPQSLSFKSIAEQTGLAAAYEMANAHQAECIAIVNESRIDSLNGKIQRDEEAARKALEEKRAASWWGLAGSVAMFVGGAVALVATAGAATPLLFALGAATATYGLAKSGSDVYNRTKQVTRLYTGDPLADLEKIDSELGDAYKKVGKYTEKGLKFNQHVEEGLAGDAESLAKARTDVKSIGYSVITEITDSAIDAATENANGATRAAAKTSNEIISEVGKQVVKGEFDGGGVISTAGKAVEIIADYRVEQADAKLEELAEDKQRIEELRDDVGMRRNWAVAF